MPRVAVADPGHVARIYRESYSLWGGGLSYDDYLGLWADLEATTWARENMRFWVLLDEAGEVLSSLKRYRAPFRVAGRSRPGTVIGALYTPARRRRRGHARALLREVLDRARADGDDLALLFSDVAPGFYEACGFRAVPAVDTFARLPRRAVVPPDGWRIEPMRREHADALVAARRATAARADVSLDRDAALWDFLRTRTKTFFRRYEGDDVRARCVVAMHDGNLAGYVVAVEGHGEWSVREVGAADGSVSTEAAVLRAAASVAARHGCRRLNGWIGEDVASAVPEWAWRHGARRRAVPMLAAFHRDVDLDRVLGRGTVDLTFLDQF